MNIKNKEGVAEPVAVVGKGNGGGVGITYLPALYSLPHGTKLYAHPPAAMPAAPSDAVIEILALVRSYGDARQDGNDNRAAGWIRDITAALQAPQPDPAAGEQAVSDERIQAALTEQQLYDIIRGTGYVTRGQAWELVELILAAQA